jgi:amicyanin
MDKKVAAVLVASVILMVGGILIYIGSNSKNKANQNTAQSQGTTSTSSSEADGQQVTIDSMAFAPQTLNVKVGDKITWTNRDSVRHTVTKDDGQTDGPASQPLDKGDSYSYTFIKAGTYAYHCSLHPTMKGTVVVSETNQRKAGSE